MRLSLTTGCFGSHTLASLISESMSGKFDGLVQDADLFLPCPSQTQNPGSKRPRKTYQVFDLNGRGSWIRTNDLQYPKLPRYQAALYPDISEKPCGYTLQPAPARRRCGTCGREIRQRLPAQKPPGNRELERDEVRLNRFGHERGSPLPGGERSICVANRVRDRSSNERPRSLTRRHAPTSPTGEVNFRCRSRQT